MRKDLELTKKLAYLKISKNYDYFAKLRDDLLTHSSSVISKHWRIFKSIKLAQETAKLHRKSYKQPSKASSHLSNQTSPTPELPVERIAIRNVTQVGSKFGRMKPVRRKVEKRFRN